ncbi:Nitrate/nitrite transporter [uncultured Gammaproteobacteria bacterium]|jgi:NNP family nitrate/nitrite transporter-like MFS transporter|uniref:MFS transporter n=1 Tax=thiotrophic endosymbiont of Bathymodiolus puteoserpentis (Logatchev) TaxID=343240 RepID=UPI0010AFB4C0|nr:MFS transporter [thiotrophic endosymbiont of Bathymodiolus puteoserpentis (Logatchev)]CAC9487124.1 Nitrate/nitrite transporter [uncultured Gammaproteobacteria bacterium]CAC9601990.1 Nitrate/nitrite transporter Npun_R1527 [uncultured Gammaproteobacteria bacterium]SSC11221.1 Nitrate/nitrite transporter [thiotrophic endosymbiont of Bathymodiolus puteoserpentis (Logatchev)]VVH51682.1 Nitrate/nitrite transporter [uncultured Gammaproteobacteria bacterium]
MEDKLNLFSFKGKYRILHLTWFAFFMTFVVWLGLGPMMPFIQEALSLTEQQAKVLLILNVAMTIPARIIVGMLVDKLGPKILFSAILILGGLISIAFSWMQSYEQLALLRFLSGFIGAGFVVGIRMISEWFPAKQTGIAQGIYGGWGNFGSAGAAFCLPFIASSFGDVNGWRYAITIASVLAILYGVFYYFNVSNTPKGSTYFKPKKSGAMEVSSYLDLALYIVMNIPLYLALSLLTWKLSPANMAMISSTIEDVIYCVLTVIFVLQVFKTWHINAQHLAQGVPRQHQYKFKQVAILDWAYLVTFGTELAVVSILAMFYVDWFELPKITAALLAGVYPFINLFARPCGGYLSDKYGRKLTLMIVFFGISLSFLALGNVDKSWSIYLVVLLTIVGGIFSKAGSGAVFAMVPLIQRRLTGQIAGMAGAFGNVGAVMFLTLNSLVDYDQFFMLIGTVSTIVLVLIVVFLEEPKGYMTEILDDGTVEIIKLN